VQKTFDRQTAAKTVYTPATAISTDNNDKKLSYRKGTARRTVSVEILFTAAQLYDTNHI